MITTPLPDPAIEPFMTIDRAAGILGIDRNLAYRLAHQGELPMVRVGRLFKVPTARFLERYQLGGQS